jgi:transcriptional regulator NrdR family protein
MPENVTTIGNESVGLRIYVYAAEGGVKVCQGMWHLIDDEVLIDSEKMARSLVKAVEKRMNASDWTDDNLVEVIRHKKTNMNTYVRTRSAAGDFKSGVLIEQDMFSMVEMAILVDSVDRLKKLIQAIRKRSAEMGWVV